MSKLNIVHNSCANLNVDVVVNAANKMLLSGGGICGVIYRKAGFKELDKACQEYKTPLNDGDAVITPSFNMKNSKYIIHAVGPNFNVTPNAFDKLYLAYYNSLILLKVYNLHSISFPLISSGIFGGNLDNPIKESFIQCKKAYQEFTTNYNYNVEVNLCAFTKEEYETIINL